MIIDGEKYACEACVRGHRVSNCQHSDRPLQHINKKGRPVSQCNHCRTMRKSRSAHVKCDCGEKTSKCAHLQQVVDGHKDTCCCNHGGRCTCCHKMEPALHTVPETDSDGESLTSAGAAHVKPPVRRRRANTVHSDAGLSFDQNGHHKPTSKISRASQKSGPYQLNRVNSATSASSMSANSESMLHGESRSRVAAARAQRRVKSEAASPLMSGSNFSAMSTNLPPLDLSQIDYPSYVGTTSFDLFGNGSGMPSDPEAPMYSAGLSAQSVDWSHYDLADKGDFTPSSYSQAGAHSFNGLFDFGSGSEQLPHLANTTSTSGEVSEVEDFMSGGDAEYDGFGAGSNSFVRNGVINGSTDISSIDYDNFYKNADNAPLAGVSMVEEDPAFWMPNYNEGVSAVDETADPLAPAPVSNYWEM